MFFFIDLFGTLSIIPEFTILFGLAVPTPDNASLARAGRAARIGSRLGRLVRMFRFEDEEPVFGPDGQKLETQPSNVGLIVADAIAARVVFLVMALIILLPLFVYAPDPNHAQMSLDVWSKTHPNTLVKGSSANSAEQGLQELLAWYNTCDYTRCPRDAELVAIQVWGGPFSCSNAVDAATSHCADTLDAQGDPQQSGETDHIKVDLREKYPDKYEIYRDNDFKDMDHNYKEAGTDHTKFTATFMIKSQKSKDSQLSLLFLVVAVLLFAVGAMMFLQDIQEHVITPIEKLTALSANLGATLSFISRDPDDEQVGFGRIVVSKTEVPNLLANLVSSDER